MTEEEFEVYLKREKSPRKKLTSRWFGEWCEDLDKANAESPLPDAYVKGRMFGIPVICVFNSGCTQTKIV
jgi:hypothetical protein